jgi:hypothetical protein
LGRPPRRSRHVDRVEHPRHRAGRFGYEVDTLWVTEFFLRLRDERRTARLQAHTHPRSAGHSETDDRFALVSVPGFLSLVIPSFAMGPIGLDDAALVAMGDDGEWVPRSTSEIEAPTVRADEAS